MRSRTSAAPIATPSCSARFMATSPTSRPEGSRARFNEMSALMCRRPSVLQCATRLAKSAAAATHWKALGSSASSTSPETCHTCLRSPFMWWAALAVHPADSLQYNRDSAPSERAGGNGGSSSPGAHAWLGGTSSPRTKIPLARARTVSSCSRSAPTRQSRRPVLRTVVRTRQALILTGCDRSTVHRAGRSPKPWYCARPLTAPSAERARSALTAMPRTVRPESQLPAARAPGSRLPSARRVKNARPFMAEPPPNRGGVCGMGICDASPTTVRFVDVVQRVGHPPKVRRFAPAKETLGQGRQGA